MYNDPKSCHTMILPISISNKEGELSVSLTICPVKNYLLKKPDDRSQMEWTKRRQIDKRNIEINIETLERAKLCMQQQ